VCTTGGRNITSVLTGLVRLGESDRRSGRVSWASTEN